MDYVSKEQIEEMELEEACCLKRAKTNCGEVSLWLAEKNQVIGKTYMVQESGYYIYFVANGYVEAEFVSGKRFFVKACEDFIKVFTALNA